MMDFFYFILSSEINAYQKQINVKSITNEMICYQSQMIDISLYFHSSDFLITSDFSLHLTHFTSELQTPITFLFVNEIIMCGYAFSYLERDKYFFSHFICLFLF